MLSINKKISNASILNFTLIADIDTYTGSIVYG